MPAAGLHIALVLVQTLGKGLRVRLTGTGAPCIVLGASLVDLASYSVVGLFSWGGRASKHSSNGVADT